MEFNLTANYQEHPLGFTGRCNEIKGIAAQGRTIKEVKVELLKLIRIKYEIVKAEIAKKPTTKDVKITTGDLAHVCEVV